MFYVYHHHDTLRLAELLAALRERQQRSPLAPDTVLVPNRSVGRWLQMQLAASEGVAANLHLPLPAKFIWGVLRSSLPATEARAREEPDSSAFERENLRWHLYALLPAIAREQPRIARYLEADPPELRRLQLAEQLADILDQYLIYRRDLLFDWEAGRERDADPDRWQAPVWRALVQRLTHRHRARLLTELVEAVEHGGELDRSQWPDPVYCFGLLHLPPDYLRLLYGISRYVDVHYLLTNPSDLYWGDIQGRPVRIHEAEVADPHPGESDIAEGHPLLASLGHPARDFLRVLYADELAGIQEPELGEALAYEPSGDGTLLHRIQSGIIRMDARPIARGVDEGDASLEIHACHGPLREVQVLRDQILDRMRRDPSLEPRDIVVMMPDVARYAPAIRSVFGDDQAPCPLPFTVSDEPRLASHPLAMTFSRLLNLPLSRWGASEVLALARVPAVMRRYGLDEAMLADLHHWVQAAGVRWGLDAATRRALGAGDWHQNSWAFGLDRLLLGIAQSEEGALVDGVAPWSDLEGAGTEALGRLYVLVERLREWRDRMAEPASAGAWHERLNQWVAALFQADPDDPEEAAALEAVHEALGVLEQAAGCLGDEPLGWEAVREILLSELRDGGERQPFLGGGITFCGLVPLRSLPFRMVALLGMDDGAFPRQDRNRSLNLLRQSPRIGDRSARSDDRLLFLQSLMAARSWLYISYTGQDVRSGEPLEPSPVVGELLDFLHRYHFPEFPRSEAVAQVTVRQPMQPFSERHFRDDTAPRALTFDERWFAGAHAQRQVREPAPPFIDGSEFPEVREGGGEAVIELAALRSVLRSPARHCLAERLRLELEPPEAALEEEEPRSVGGLAGHQLRRELLEAHRAPGSEPPEDPDPALRARGILPPPPLDRGAYQCQRDRVLPILPVWQGAQKALAEGAPCTLDIRLCGGERLTGRLPDAAPHGLLRIHPGRLHGERRLADWIDYLALVVAVAQGGLHTTPGAPGPRAGEAAARELQLRIAGLDPQDRLGQQQAHVTPEAAAEHLAALVAAYHEARRRPVPFRPSLGATYAEDIQGIGGKQSKSRADALSSRNGYLSNTHHTAWELRADPWLRLAAPPPSYLGEDPESSGFCRMAEAVCGPLLRELRDTDWSGAATGEGAG
ncbi:exodeoxyribonuclease V subunit gamma [Halorhodospira halophila]|uniref:exodeoxyribonuclease V subunit gamma n=1 Tax=Halorhodospira halophila TaxID=1053 RepID=UPI001A91108F|nr:exodeoxyribonuclease V subunit gamma [Halorhodospira halophila]MBK5935424.1 exodeoxyribonuclease V subunit gamma [Halorhodospira halophila]